MQVRFQASAREGYETIVKDNQDLKYIREFGILRLTRAGSFEASTGSCEAILHLIEGSCSLTAGGKTYNDLGKRETPFDGKPTAVYLPPGTDYAISSSRVEIAITLAAADGGSPVVIEPEGLAPNQVGKDNWERTVTMIAPPDFSSQSLILGETLNPPGNWSGVPAHKHDTATPDLESGHEELYYFRTERPGAWGIERIYDKQDLEELVLLQDRVVTIMPRGYHTVASAPGYNLYYAFVIAGPRKPFVAAMDPDQGWIAS